MAKKSMIEREKKRFKLHTKYNLKRVKLLKQYQQADTFSLKLEVHTKIQKLPRNSSKTRIRNRCILTGRSRSVYRLFRFSRIVFRDLASHGEIPGVQKSSW